MKFDEMIKDRVKYNRMPTKCNSTVRSKSINQIKKQINQLLLAAAGQKDFYVLWSWKIPINLHFNWCTIYLSPFRFRTFFRFNCIPVEQKTDLIDVDSTLSLDSLFEETIQIFNVTNFHPVNAVEPNTPVIDMKSWFC